MKLWRLILREISHRMLNFVLGCSSVCVAVACLVGAMTLLHADELRTREILDERTAEVASRVREQEKAVETAGKELEDAMRKITKGLGFNILILPKEQDLNELQVEGTLSKTMKEEYVDRLANSKIMTVNHLLPMVMKKIEWKEMNRSIILTGTRGEVPLMHRALKKPLQDQVPAGTMVVGFQLHSPTDETRRKVSKGETVTLLEKQFKVTKLLEERGTADDYTVWINLAEAQRLLKLENLVNAILALECNCATQDRVAEIRAEIASILPGTQVIERGPPALARAEARNTAKQAAMDALDREKKEGVATIDQEKQSRAQFEQRREQFAAVLVPLAFVGSAVWIAFLTFGNVRQRSSEIGILRAIGLRSGQILTIFLGKAVVMGLLGAVIGCGLGLVVGLTFGDLPLTAESWSQLFASGVLLAVVLFSPIFAPLLAGLASWIPAMLAAQQDPAVVLQDQ